MATFNATTGVDTPTQTTGDDTLIISNTNQIQPLDVFDGNTGNDKVLISGLTGVTVNVTAAGAAAFKNYEAISFDNTSSTSTFEVNASQIGALLGQLPNTLNLEGAAGGKQQISVIGATTFSAASWTFTDWSSADRVIINGTSAANTLTGSIKTDILVGGLGSDTYNIQNSTDIITELANQGTDTVNSSANHTLGSHVENLNLTGSANLTGQGNSLNNIINGNSGDNTIDGKSGADQMNGGLGNDTYYVDNIGDVITDTGGLDSVVSSVTYTIASGMQDLTLTGSAAINGTGNSLYNKIYGNTNANVLRGEGGNDTLDGKAGADNMNGGIGNDTYYIDNAGDVVSESGGSGTDLVWSTVTHTLGTGFENLTLFGAAAINGTGNADANILIGNGAINTLTGNDGNDTLDGAGGADNLVGGLGDDTYIVDSLTESVVESLNQGIDLVKIKVDHTMAANVENLTMALSTSSLDATGNTLNNIMTGNANRNKINGGAGNDTIDGGASTDTLTGGDGDDILIVDNIGDVVVELSSQGTDTIQSSVTYTMSDNVENMILTGTNAINGTGNANANSITGNNNNNTIDGKAGADTMTGGLGNDTYIVDTLSDSVVEAASGGTDTVNTATTYTLSATQEVENLTLTGSAAVNGTGNALNNVIIGNSAVNILSGAVGTDTLTGGLGNDTFLFSALNHSNTASGIDTITDFATGDKINVSAIDANTGVGGDQAFVADANGTFVAGEYSVVTDVDGYVFVNFYNDGVAGFDMQIRVKAAALSDVDFVL